MLCDAGFGLLCDEIEYITICQSSEFSLTIKCAFLRESYIGFHDLHLLLCRHPLDLMIPTNFAQKKLHWESLLEQAVSARRVVAAVHSC